MALESANSGNHNGAIRLQAGIAALEIPEFLEADVGAESAFGEVIIRKLKGQFIRHDGGLTDGDIGKRSSVNKNGLSFNRLQQAWIDSIDHPCAHGAIHFKIGCRDGIAFFIVSNHHFADSFTHIFEAGGDSENRHQFGAYGNGESGLHHEAIHLAAHSRW